MGVLLSLIVPVYNEERRLPATLDTIFDFLDSQAYTAEVLVVENGSQDNTIQIAEAFEASHANYRLLIEQRRGKGLAVRRGMLEARGEYRFICDADLSMPITEVNRFLPPQLDDFDIAIASRELPGAIRYGEPVYRHLIGRVFNHVVRAVAVPGFQDTQCGFKCFRAAVAEDLFGVQQLEGMGFDVEILFVGTKRGYKIVEVPIPWYYDPDSRVRLAQDSLAMFRDLFRIRRNWRQGFYDRPN